MKVVFLDRDGTIIQDPSDERVDSVDKIELFEDSIKALKYLADNDFGVVIDLDLEDIYMVGDNQSDIDAGINAGCKGGILVKTARNKVVASPNATYSAPNLLNAARYIVDNNGGDK